MVIQHLWKVLAVSWTEVDVRQQELDIQIEHVWWATGPCPLENLSLITAYVSVLRGKQRENENVWYKDIRKLAADCTEEELKHLCLVLKLHHRKRLWTGQIRQVFHSFTTSFNVDLSSLPFSPAILYFHLEWRCWHSHTMNLKEDGKNSHMLHPVGINCGKNCGKGPFPRWGDGYRPTFNVSKWTLTTTQSKIGRSDSVPCENALTFAYPSLKSREACLRWKLFVALNM